MAVDESRSVKRWILVSALLLFCGQVALALEGYRQDDKICSTVEVALDAYTAGLVLGSTPEEGRTEEELAEVQARVKVLEGTYKPVLSNC